MLLQAAGRQFVQFLLPENLSGVIKQIIFRSIKTAALL